MEREDSSHEWSEYGDYYTSDFAGGRHSDQALAGVDTEYGERAQSEGRPGVDIGDRTRGDLEEPPPQRYETGEPRSDVASTGEAARREATPQLGAEGQETSSVRVYKRAK